MYVYVSEGFGVCLYVCVSDFRCVCVCLCHPHLFARNLGGVTHSLCMCEGFGVCVNDLGCVYMYQSYLKPFSF